LATWSRIFTVSGFKPSSLAICLIVIPVTVINYIFGIFEKNLTKSLICHLTINLT
jgi:hypothetical protein